MAGPNFNDPAYGFPSQGGILGGQGGAPSGILGGGFGSAFRQLLDPAIAMPMAAALIGGRTPQESLAGAFAQAGPGLVASKKRMLWNAWLKAGAPKDPNAPTFQALMSGDTDFAEKMALARMNGGQTQYGMTPIWGKDKNGKTVLMQMSGAGGISQLDTGGVEPLDPLHFVNTGTEAIPVGTRTGAPREGAAAIPLNPQGKAAAAAAGQLQGQAQTNLPMVENAAERLKGAIDGALSDPNLKNVTGPVDSQWPNWMRSGASQTAQSRIDQVLGGTFLQAYNDLRGGGQISDAEGRGAKDAYNRLLSVGQSDEEYRKALIEFRDQVDKLVEVARKRAGAGEAAPQQATPASAGGVIKAEDYFK